MTWSYLESLRCGQLQELWEKGLWKHGSDTNQILVYAITTEPEPEL
jgi:hypothetical protein